jgi:3-demethoxyubiquinol 3-hydroxylase
MSKVSPAEQLTIRRILKVNHAGEHGAIQIYSAQIAIAKHLYPEIVDRLVVMRGHEVTHHELFANAMLKRSARPCRLLFLWSWGGWCLGAVTALNGRRMIWICTEAVEATVHHHLTDQLHFLKNRDNELHTIIESIQEEELGHLSEAIASRGEEILLTRITRKSIAIITDILIWMSTSGDSSRLAAQLKRLS